MNIEEFKGGKDYIPIEETSLFKTIKQCFDRSDNPRTLAHILRSEIEQLIEEVRKEEREKFRMFFIEFSPEEVNEELLDDLMQEYFKP